MLVRFAIALLFCGSTAMAQDVAETIHAAIAQANESGQTVEIRIQIVPQKPASSVGRRLYNSPVGPAGSESHNQWLRRHREEELARWNREDERREERKHEPPAMPLYRGGGHVEKLSMVNGRINGYPVQSEGGRRFYIDDEGSAGPTRKVFVD